MTAKSPDDKRTNDPGASAAPRTLMEWLAKKFPTFFHTSPCPEDMSGFFEALEDEKLRECIGHYIQFVAPDGKNRMYGMITGVGNRYKSEGCSFLAVEQVTVDRYGRIHLTGIHLSVEKDDVKLGPYTPEEFNANVCKPARNQMTADEKMAERFDKLKDNDRKKRVRATAELLMVEAHANHMRNSSFGKLADRVAREAYDRAVEIHDALDRIEKIQAVIDDEPMDVKPTVPRPVGAE